MTPGKGQEVVAKRSREIFRFEARALGGGTARRISESKQARIELSGNPRMGPGSPDRSNPA